MIGMEGGTPFRFTNLKSGLRTIEDKLAIYELIAFHPPNADMGNELERHHGHWMMAKRRPLLPVDGWTTYIKNCCVWDIGCGRPSRVVRV